MRKTLIFRCIVSGALLFAVPAAQAAVFNVTDAAGFQSALTTAAGNGADDTVNVAAGTYNIPSTLTFSSVQANALAIVGAGAASTFIDGGGAMRVMTLEGAGDISVSGLTIRNGSTVSAAGLAGTGTGDFTISDCVFSGNHATSLGGGFFIGGVNLTFTGTTSSNNTAGVRGGGGLMTNYGTTVISDSTFSGNTAGTGGGLYLGGSDPISITGSAFSGNTTNVGSEGGGLWVFHPGPGALTITDSLFSGNLASGSCSVADLGVGIRANTRGPVFFTRNIVENNTTACQGQGAGILLNHALPSTATVVVADNIFSGNASGPGSAFGPVTLGTEAGVLNVVNNTFSGNDSGEPTTGDVFLDVTQDTGVLNVSNNIFFGGAGEDELEIRNDGDGNLTTSPATFRNNIVDPFQVTFTPGGGVTVSGNFDADPLFTDLAGGDFHLMYDSPAIDAGLSTAPGIRLFDFDGDDRIMGAAVDIGADEFIPPNPATFFPATGTLAIPEVQLGAAHLMYDAGVKAYQVRMTRLDGPGYVFTLANGKKMPATAVPSATFDTATGVLLIPFVRVQGLAKTYHVRMQRRPGGYVFDLTKATKN